MLMTLWINMSLANTALEIVLVPQALAHLCPPLLALPLKLEQPKPEELKLEEPRLARLKLAQLKLAPLKLARLKLEEPRLDLKALLPCLLPLEKPLQLLPLLSSTLC